jgi:integrase
MPDKNVHFYLVHPKKDKSAIYLRFYYHSRALTCSTGISIETHMWDFKKQAPKKSTAHYTTYKIYLERVEQIVIAYYKKALEEGKLPPPEEIRLHLRNTLKNNTDSLHSFFDYLEAYYQWQQENKTPALTLKPTRTLINMLQEFETMAGYQLTFKRIDKTFEDKFRAYLLQRKTSRYKEKGVPEGLLNATIAKYFSKLKAFMKWALERGYHDNEVFRNFNASRRNDKPRGGGKNDIVVLTEEEFEQLRDYDFSADKRLEKVRDLFLFACYTAQRWSDVAAFCPEQIKGNCWEFTSYKTKDFIRVPLVGWCGGALEILKKYKGNLPNHISQHNFNNIIKEVCRVAGITATTRIQRYSGNQLVTIECPKYELVSSHCARRTAITILGTQGIPLNVLQRLTGHDDVETLMKYVNTPEDALERWLRQLDAAKKEGIS